MVYIILSSYVYVYFTFTAFKVYTKMYPFLYTLFFLVVSKFSLLQIMLQKYFNLCPLMRVLFVWFMLLLDIYPGIELQDFKCCTFSLLQGTVSHNAFIIDPDDLYPQQQLVGYLNPHQHLVLQT